MSTSHVPLPATPVEVATCIYCDEPIFGVRRVENAHCYGCGAHVCVTCCVLHDRSMPAGPHTRNAHLGARVKP